ncbi:MAG TPA: helix-turn-helix transcriptional regulator [Vicinamibacteria bacterium]|nr:helix-turn-helix transcriptional regulator [Vicinamibacteria bacterium]
MTRPSALSPTDFHVLLVLASGDLYGYAILKAVREESSGAVRPEIGSLYRVLARLMSLGLVDEVEAPGNAPAIHRGRTRRYYRLTRRGRDVLASETRRLETAVRIARKRARDEGAAGS